VDDGDPEAQILHVGQDLGEVLLRAHHHRVTDGTVTRQHREIAVNLGLDALTTPWPQLGQAQLDAWQVSQSVMLGGAPALDGGLVPVATQQREAGPVAGEVAEELQQALVIPADRLSPTRSVDGHRAVREHVARVYEQRATIHATPSFLGARTLRKDDVTVRGRLRPTLR
jgi:hypothetical protein